KSALVVPSKPYRGRQGQRVSCARLLLGGRDDPDVVAEFSRDRFEQPEPAGVHAVVVGEEYSHCGAMREVGCCCNCAGRTSEMRHIRNSLSISSLARRQCLLRIVPLSIAPAWGW